MNVTDPRTAQRQHLTTDTWWTVVIYDNDPDSRGRLNEDDEEEVPWHN